MKKDISFRHDKRERKFAKWSILLITCFLTVFCFIIPPTVFGQCGELFTLSSPSPEELAVGETYQLQAKCMDYGRASVAIRINFEIDGPNSSSSGYADTDTSGVATFNYQGNQQGTDSITAKTSTHTSNILTVTWKPQSSDIRIETGPTKLNVNSQGVLPMIVFGDADFNVQMIDPSSLRLNGAVLPLQVTYEDVASKSGVEPDGFLDMCLKFDTQEIVDTLGDTLNDGDIAELVLIGKLYDEEQTAIQTARTATSIRAVEEVMITNKGKRKKGK
jgi:hypothetical protein